MPFAIIRALDEEGVLGTALKDAGLVPHTRKARTLSELAHSDLDLRTCGWQDLEVINGIGHKTSRYFILYSREGVDDLAPLDRHILTWLREQGHDVPKNTPTSLKRYQEIEEIFLEYASKQPMSVAEFNYAIWRQMRETARGASNEVQQVEEAGKMKTLGTWDPGRGKTFQYSGFVADGTTIRYGKNCAHTVQISSHQYADLLAHFRGCTVNIGTDRVKPPSGSVGEWLKQNVAKTGVASYVGPILVAEGYAERVGGAIIRSRE